MARTDPRPALLTSPRPRRVQPSAPHLVVVAARRPRLLLCSPLLPKKRTTTRKTSTRCSTSRPRTWTRTWAWMMRLLRTPPSASRPRTCKTSLLGIRPPSSDQFANTTCTAPTRLLSLRLKLSCSQLWRRSSLREHVKVAQSGKWDQQKALHIAGNADRWKEGFDLRGAWSEEASRTSCDDLGVKVGPS